MKKKLLTLFLATIILLGNISCQRGTRSLLGDYSYKISGEVTITSERPRSIPAGVLSSNMYSVDMSSHLYVSSAFHL